MGWWNEKEEKGLEYVMMDTFLSLKENEVSAGKTERWDCDRGDEGGMSPQEHQTQSWQLETDAQIAVVSHAHTQMYIHFSFPLKSARKVKFQTSLCELFYSDSGTVPAAEDDHTTVFDATCR